MIERGLVREVLATRAATRRARGLAGTRTIDLGAGLLAPGYVNAHAHLELTGLRDALPRAGSFTDWIQSLIEARRARGNDALSADWQRGAERLLATGTTLAGDIDASDAIERADRSRAPRVRRYREVLDAGDSSRRAAALRRVDVRASRAKREYAGLSPHAPYTVSRALWDDLASRARAARVSIHFAETREESDWMLDGAGPFSTLLAQSPRESGLDAIERAGLLSPRTSLVHANAVTETERERIARAGASIVHCPGTHAFFAREPFDARAWIDAGVRVALGTDSLASNDDLDMGREMARFRAHRPELAPEIVFEAATTNAAAALGFEGRAGALMPGAWADCVLHDVDAASARSAVEALTRAASRPRRVWIGGSEVPIPLW